MENTSLRSHPPVSSLRTPEPLRGHDCPGQNVESPFSKVERQLTKFSARPTKTVTPTHNMAQTESGHSASCPWHRNDHQHVLGEDLHLKDKILGQNLHLATLSPIYPYMRLLVRRTR